MDRGSAAALRAAAHERFGRIDIVVNNAGGGGSSLERFDEQEWLDVYTANVTSALRLVHECLPDLRAQRWGRIVNVASTAARHCDPRFGAYGAAKAALLHLSRNLALAYSGEGVLTNCVLPGLTRTDGVLAGLRRRGGRHRPHARADRATDDGAPADRHRSSPPSPTRWRP